MADKKINIKEVEKLYRDLNQNADRLRELQEEELNTISNIFDMRKKQFSAEQKYITEREKLNNMSDTYNKLSEEGYKIEGNTYKAFKKRYDLQTKQLKIATRSLQIHTAISRTLTTLSNKTIPNLFSFLMDADKAIKSTSLELGISGERAAMLRDNFEGAAGYAARLGSSIEDLRTVQVGFADETGRAKILTDDMLENVIAMGKGTALGISQATQLAGQFELMGYNVRATMDYVQGVVDSSERMGVNTTKVLKKVNENFKVLQKYTFQDGVAGFAKMAQHAEKFKYNMTDVLDSAEKARTLEGAVDLAAQLQVMGGEFAKTDPFEILFLSRNDPAAYAKKINEMTKGIAGFRKNAEGAFETYISPMDIDRLEKVGQALGMQRGELTQQARRLAEIQKMRQQMLGTGLSGEEKKIIEGLATYDNRKDKFFVQVGGRLEDITKLTSEQIKSLQLEQKTLEQRAMEAQTFDDVWRATINELKSSLLPMLDGINNVLQFIRPFVVKLGEGINKLTESKSGLLAFGGMLLAGGQLWSKLLKPLAGIFANKIGMNALKTKAATLTAGATPATTAGVGKGGFGKSFGGGLGVGVAGAGIGAGVGIAAKGIEGIAKAMENLDTEKVEALKSIVNSLTIFGGIAAAAGVGVALLGTTATAAAPGLLALGGAVALVGTGIGIAAGGIGYMASGLAELIDKGSQAKGSLGEIATGILAINSAMALGGVTSLFGGAGLATFSGTIKTIANNADSLQIAGNAFGNIATVLKGTKQDFKQIENTVKTISDSNFNNNSAITELASLLKSPLKVEFANKDVGFNASINVNVDGNKMFNESKISERLIIKQVDSQQGKGSSRYV